MTEMVLSARNSTPAKPVPVAQRPMSELVEQAQYLARAGEAVPKNYRNSPGACLLAIDLASHSGKPLIWVMQNVAFINGKPLVEANGIIEIAADNDYQIKLVSLDDSAAMVELIDTRTGEVAGEWTSTIAADANSKNPVWRSHPRHMLRANAIRNVWKFYGQPRGGTYMVSADEIVEMDPVEVLAPVAEATPEPAAIEDVPMFDAGPPDHVGAIRAALKAAGITQGELLKRHPGKTIDDLAADPDLRDEVMAWLS